MTYNCTKNYSQQLYQTHLVFPVGGETCKSWERLPPWGHTRHWFWHLLAIITIFFFSLKKMLYSILYLLGPLNRGFKVCASTEFRLSWMSFDCYSLNILRSVTNCNLQYIAICILNIIWMLHYVHHISFISNDVHLQCFRFDWRPVIVVFFRVLNIIWLSQFGSHWISTTDNIWLLK